MAAACPTVEEFKGRFMAFENTPDEQIEIYLQDACNFLSPELFGDCYTIAVLYYAAHCLSIALKTAERSSSTGVPAPEPAGNVTSSTSGGLSVGYSASGKITAQEGYYNLTPYGRQFVALAKNCVHTSDTAGFSFPASACGGW